VENALDASESIEVLPTIELTITEMDEVHFNQMRGLVKHQRKDHKLYTNVPPLPSSAPHCVQTLEEPLKEEANEAGTGVGASAVAASGGKPKKPKRADANLYYKITCRDNGSGMPHSKIPDMLGRVLSGSKYGVRQTRGKFGLGAKMVCLSLSRGPRLSVYRLLSCQSRTVY
jgi:DNA topoisomerase-6 subunit B